MQAVANSSSWCKTAWVHRYVFSFEKNAFKYAFCRKKKYKPLQQKKICSKWYQSLFSHYLHQPDMNVFLWRPAVSLRRNLWFAAAKDLLVQASHILWCIYYRLAMSFQHIYYDTLFSRRNWLWELYGQWWNVRSTRSLTQFVLSVNNAPFFVMFLLW